ncbi:MAG: glycosyltransferase [Planctomycetota bacterium]|nr:glycosyltransferase [Planctomycetota bacterium]
MTRAERPIRSISVLMPTWQGAEFLERVLEALAAQRTELAWDFLAVDSGSTDGTLAILERFAGAFPVPFRVHGIHQVEFDHGDTRNLLAALSTGDLLVYLTQDAIPTSSDWLATLAASFASPEVGAATCRNVPRPDAHVLTKLRSRDDPGYAEGRREVRLPPADEYEAMSPHERRLLYNFNDVASAVRRELWELHPFPRTPFGEDVLMARALLEAGFTVVYDDRATVEHSHDYTPDETYARARIDGRFNAEWFGRTCVASPEDARALERRFASSDAEALATLGGDAPHGSGDTGDLAGELRAAAFRGLFDGGLTERRRPATALLDRRELHVLYVVHGFPPDTWAGTEVYTLNLAREMEALGHRATIFARVPPSSIPSAEADEDFTVRASDFEGLRVLRMTHRLDHGSLRESYHQPRAEEAFRRVLARERPDVVHFQHLIHTSAGLVEVARDAGLPTVLTCHDYWAICPRVQLIRPDGVRCPESMGAGCYACVKEKHLTSIPLLKRMGAAGGAVFEGLMDELGLADYGDLAARADFVQGAYAAADLRISPSRFLRAKLLETGRFDPHTFLFSDNGMRTDHVHALEKRPDPEGRIRFGFVGSLVWYKGGETMVRAMARLPRRSRRGIGRDAVLNVHGDFRPDTDEHHAHLARLAKESDADNVRFLGRFDNSRLSEVYAEIDVLIVPSIWYENSPITIHEAYLTGTPVIASGIGGMAEYVRDGVDGLHFEAGDEAGLAAAMARVLDEPGLLEELSRDLPAVKTIAENAREMEFRYRGLCCLRRDGTERSERILVDVLGNAADRREGPVEEQGVDMLLLRPGGAAVEYDLSSAGPGAREVRIDVQALGDEEEVELGGRVLLDGELLGVIDRFVALEGDERRSFRFSALFAPNRPLRLRVESAGAEHGPEAHLRLCRIVVREMEDAPVESRAEMLA